MIVSIIPKCDEIEKEQLNIALEIIDNLLKSKLNTLFAVAGLSIEKIRSIIKNAGILPKSSRVFTLLLISSMSIMRFSSLLLNKLSVDNSPLFDELNIVESEQTESSELVLCRICEEYVPVELIEAHSLSCVKASQTEAVLESIDGKIASLVKLIAEQFLNVEWASDKDNQTILSLPVLQLYFLLERALNAQPSISDSVEELHQILKCIISIPEKADYSEISSLSFDLVRDKYKKSTAFHFAKEVLKQTRVSGSSKTALSVTTLISDFEFLKLISKGAYARVFLARKKKTGDIYAVKVLPKSDLTQKNQVKRVLTERDILLQFINPFVIDFCMFFFF